MNTRYKRDIHKTSFLVEESVYYEEDYQMHMLRKNHIEGLLEVEGHGIDDQSQYVYDVSGMVSMQTCFENKMMEKSDITEFILQLVKLIHRLHNYLLDPDKLLIGPEYIFMEKNQWYFCYFPVAKGSLCHSFHELTEYFVSQVNYEKKEGIHLAYELHKATMQENYDIEKIMGDYEQQEEDPNLAINQLEERGNIFSLEEEEDDGEEPVFYEDVQVVREMGNLWGTLKKAFHKKMQSKWGAWEQELPWEEPREDE